MSKQGERSGVPAFLYGDPGERKCQNPVHSEERLPLEAKRGTQTRGFSYQSPSPKGVRKGEGRREGFLTIVKKQKGSSIQSIANRVGGGGRKKSKRLRFSFRGLSLGKGQASKKGFIMAARVATHAHKKKRGEEECKTWDLKEKMA